MLIRTSALLKKQWATLLASAALFFPAAVTSQATSAMNITVILGLFLADTTTPVPVGSLVQVVWTPDPVVDHLPIATTFDAAGYNAVGEQLMFEGVTTDPGGWAGDLDGTALYDFSNPASLGNTPGDSISVPSTTGYVYGRAFDGPDNLSIQGGVNFFHQTPLVLLDNDADVIPADLPDEVAFSPLGGGGPGPSGAQVLDNPVFPIIPEPSTLGLLAMAGISLAALRRRPI